MRLSRQSDKADRSVLTSLLLISPFQLADITAVAKNGTENFAVRIRSYCLFHRRIADFKLQISLRILACIQSVYP